MKRTSSYSTTTNGGGGRKGRITMASSSSNHHHQAALIGAAGDIEPVYVSMLGMMMTAMFIASGYHQHVVDVTLERYDAADFPPLLSPGTRDPCVKVAVTLGFFLAVALLYAVGRRARREAIRRLFAYREWIYRPKAFTTKLWMLCLKVLLPKKRSLYCFQDVLPRYPLPTLDFTCDRALRNLEPLVTPERFAELKAAMEKFRNGDGKRLQKLLEKRYEVEENWVADIWDKYAYLVGRYPLLYTNFCMGGGLLRSDLTSVTKGLPQAAVAAAQIHHMTRFYELIKDETLEPLMMTNLIPICNQRYRHMFATTRIPGSKMDVMKTYEDSKHIIVFRKGSMFNLPLYGTDLNTGTESLLAPDQIQHQIELILQHTDGNETAPNPAVFTSLPRSQWHKEREKLMMRSQNRESLQQVERALFHVVLDEASPQNLSEECHTNLCGSGYDRWYDKSLTLIIYENGLTGGNVEHTAVDATLPSRGLEYMFAKIRFDAEGNALAPPNDSHNHVESLTPPFSIDWSLDESQTESLVKYREAHLQQSGNLEMLAVKLNTGKGAIKKCRVSPDSFMQMALQLTFYKMHQFTPKTYETAMTRFFKFGRTETIRTVSKHSVAFTKAMVEGASNEEKLRHLKNAMKEHNDYKLNAMNGVASDRSLFGLMSVSKISDPEHHPDLFQMPELTAGDQLSTSQSPFAFDLKLSKHLNCYPAGGAFAPQTTDGYGVYYLFIGENNMTIHVSCYRCHPSTSSEKFTNVLQESMNEIKSLLQTTQSKQ